MIQESSSEHMSENNHEPVQQLDQSPEEMSDLQETGSNQEAKPQETAEEKNLRQLKEAKNFRQLKEQKEKAERERDEALRVAQEIQARLKQDLPTKDTEDDNLYINPDDIVEGKHLSKFHKKIQKLEQQIKEYQQQTTSISVEARLKNQYPDFDTVVSKENIENLKEQYPELASTLQSTPDLYNKAVSAYTLIKKLGIYTPDLYTQERALAQKNAAKPKPLASVNPQQGDTPLSKANAFANGLTEELKLQLRREMEEARKGY